MSRLSACLKVERWRTVTLVDSVPALIVVGETSNPEPTRRLMSSERPVADTVTVASAPVPWRRMTSGKVELARRMGAPESSTKRTTRPSSALSLITAPCRKEVNANKQLNVKQALSRSPRSKKLFIMMYLFVLVSECRLKAIRPLVAFSADKITFFFPCGQLFSPFFHKLTAILMKESA